jgi:hypothetical protein
MKYNNFINDFRLILTLSIALTIVGFFNNANAIFHGQDNNNKETLDASKQFIMNLFDNVNNASNEFQAELETGVESINNENNITIVNKTSEYIDNLEIITSLAKEYNIHEDYKPVLNNYINSLQNEIESYTHYKNYILTSNNTENKLSLDLLSNALNYETEAIEEFKKLQEQ